MAQSAPVDRVHLGHLKADHRTGRCHLKGEQGDRLHAVLYAAGCNTSGCCA